MYNAGSAVLFIRPHRVGDKASEEYSEGPEVGWMSEHCGCTATGEIVINHSKCAVQKDLLKVVMARNEAAKHRAAIR